MSKKILISLIIIIRNDKKNIEKSIKNIAQIVRDFYCSFN